MSNSEPYWYIHSIGVMLPLHFRNIIVDDDINRQTKKKQTN